MRSWIECIEGVSDVASQKLFALCKSYVDPAACVEFVNGSFYNQAEYSMDIRAIKQGFTTVAKFCYSTRMCYWTSTDSGWSSTGVFGGSSAAVGYGTSAGHASRHGDRGTGHVAKKQRRDQDRQDRRGHGQ